MKNRYLINDKLWGEKGSTFAIATIIMYMLIII